MTRHPFHTLQLWQFQSFSSVPDLVHYVSDRNSSGQRDFTLSLSSTPDKEQVKNNRRALAMTLGIPEDNLYFPSQVHGTRVVVVTPETTREDVLETDALITSTPHLCISVMSADCVPVLLFDRKNRVAAAVHAGWRGTVARIVERTLSIMKEKYGSAGKDILAGIGPSVSQDAYEVGGEVIEEVIKSFGHFPGLLIPQHGNKAKLDLWKANALQLEEFGIPEANVEIGNLCTVKHNDHFYSARRGDAGRFAAGIMIR